MTAASRVFAEEQADDTCVRLAEIVRKLASPRRVIEREFSDMGERLTECVGLLNQIAGAHAGTSSTLQGEEFGAAVSRLGAIRDRIGTMAAQSGGTKDSVGPLATTVASISGPVEDLAKSVRAIGVIALNAKIAAAGFGGKSTDLGDFTSDMARLARHAADEVTAFSAAYGGIAKSLSIARSSSEVLTTKCKEILGAISLQLSEHLGTLDHFRNRAAAKAVDHVRLTEQIRSRVGIAMSALQIGDISRQRIEHAEQALEMLGGHLLRLGATDPAHRRALVTACSALQAAQIAEAVNDYDREVASLIGSLKQLTEDGDGVLKENNQEAEVLLASGGTALAGMVGNLRDLCASLEELDDTRSRLDRVAGEIARAMAAMFGHLDAIHGIEQNLLMLGVNTSIYCSRLGAEGRVLNVIAQELHGCTEEAVAAARAITAGLRAAGALVQELEGRLSSDEASTIAALEHEASATVGLIGSVVDRIRESVMAVSAIGPRAVDLLEHAAAKVLDRHRLGDEWRAACGELNLLVEDDADLASAGADAAEMLSALRRHYTMQSERRLHDALFAIRAADKSGQGTTQAAAGSDAELQQFLF